MTSYKMKKVSSILILTTFLFIATLGSVSAASPKGDFSPYLGDGPSPSAAWEVKDSYNVTLPMNN